MKLTRIISRAGLLLSATLVSSCHFFVTGPRLYDHGSSAAFDLWLGLWIFCGLLYFVAIVVDIDFFEQNGRVKK